MSIYNTTIIQTYVLGGAPTIIYIVLNLLLQARFLPKGINIIIYMLACRYLDDYDIITNL